MKPILRATLTALLLSISLAACGPPTLQGAESRYKSNQDRLSAIVTRQPQARPEIDAKIAEFRAEYDKAMAQTGEEQQISALSALSARMDRYIEMLEPKAAKTGGAGAPSDKLDAPPATASQVSPPVAPPGKLDGPAPAGEAIITPGVTPTPTPTPSPVAPGSAGMGGL